MTFTFRLDKTFQYSVALRSIQQTCWWLILFAVAEDDQVMLRFRGLTLDILVASRNKYFYVYYYNVDCINIQSDTEGNTLSCKNICIRES